MSSTIRLSSDSIQGINERDSHHKEPDRCQNEDHVAHGSLPLLSGVDAIAQNRSGLINA